MSAPSSRESPAQSSGGHFLVAVADELVYARVIGQGNMENSVALKGYLNASRERGREKFVVDLSECSGFDSTFMGTLLGLVLTKAVVVVINVRDEHRKLLREVGLHRLMTLCDGAIPLPEVPLSRLDSAPVKPQARIRLMLDAHENLVKVDRENQQKFGAFIRLLRDELGSDATL